MNKIYRLVWNKSLNIWTVVSENARGVTKKRNVAANTSIKTAVSLSNSQYQQVLLRPSLIAIALSSVFFSTGAFAAVNTGGGASSNGSSMAISPSNDQCSGMGGQASITNGTTGNGGGSVAVGCGNNISGTDSTWQQGLVNRRGTGNVAYGAGVPTGNTGGVLTGSTAVGRQNTIRGVGGATVVGTANNSSSSSNFHNVLMGQGNSAVGTGGYNTLMGVGNQIVDDAASNPDGTGVGTNSIAIGIANRVTGQTSIAFGRQSYADADYSIAQGNVATVNKGATGGIALGFSATVDGKQGVAIGSASGVRNYDPATSARANEDAVAVGTRTNASTLESVAIGAGSEVTGTNIGLQQQIGNRRGTGTNNYPSGAGNYASRGTAVGQNNKISNLGGGTAIGSNNTISPAANPSSAGYNIVIGQGNLASDAYNTALGIGNDVSKGTSNTAIGVNNIANGNTAIAMGRGTNALADFSIAQGNTATVASGATGGIALGNSANTTGVRGIAIGSSTGGAQNDTASAPNAIGTDAIALGTGAKGTSDNDIAIGRNAATAAGSGGDNIAMGNGVVTGATGKNVAIGSEGTTANSRTGDGGAVSIGRGQRATGDGAVAIGDPNVANGDGAIALGKDNIAAGDTAGNTVANGAVALGYENQAIGQGSVALGHTSVAAAAGAIALGDNANAQASRGVALGSNAVASNADDVALGSGSVTSAANPTSNGTVGDITYNYAGTSPSSVVSVGSEGNERQITNVAAGRVSETSTDAINGSQLYSTQQALGNLAESTANHLGGGSTVNPDGSVTAPSYTVNGNNVTNIGAAISELDKGWNLQSNGANGAPIKAGDTVDIGTVAGEENLTVTKDGNNIKYGLNRDLKVDSVRAGDTLINDNGVTIANGPSITKSGINAAGNPISNVGAGVNDTDAVNKGQLDKAAAASKTEVTQGKNITVTKTTGLDGQDIYNVATADNVDFNNVTVGGANGVNIDGNTGKISGVTAGEVSTTSDEAINGSQLAGTAKSVSDALGGGSTVNPDGTVTAPSYTVNGETVRNVGDAITELDKGWNLQSNGANAGAIRTGDTVDIGTVAGEENLTVTKDGNNIKYGLNRDLKVDSVRAGDTLINDNGVTIANGPSITKSGINAAGNPISNVGAGVEDTDAVNKGQLDKAAAAAKTEVTQGKNITVTKTTGLDGQDIYNVATADNVDFNNVTVGGANGVNINGTTGKISGVTAGEVSTTSDEAINGSQLAGTAKSVSDALGGGSTVNPDGTVTAPSYTVNGETVRNVGDAITELDKGWNLQSNAANAGAIRTGDTVDIGTATGEENLTVTKDGNNIKYGLNRDLKVDSVRAGDTLINDNGVTIANGPSITKSGINAAGNPISNVGAGVEDTDAVNKGQLDKAAAAAKTEVTQGKNITVTKTTGLDGQDIYNVATADNVDFNNVTVGGANGVNIDGTTGKISGVTAGEVSTTSDEAINGSQLAGTAKSVSDALGGGSTVNPDGTVTAPSYTVNGETVRNVGDAITELDKGWNLQSNGANAGAIRTGDTVDIGTVAGEENLTVTKDGNNIKYGLNRDLKVDSVRAGDTLINDNGVTIANGPSITKSGINAAGNPISNVGAGVEDTDAVNKGQLDKAAAAAKTEVTQGKNITVSKTTGADGQDIYNVATADNVDFNNVTVGGANGVNIDGATGKISGVTAGEVSATSDEAINGSQLAGTAKSVSDALGGGSTVNPDGTVTAPSYTVNGETVRNVGDAITELDKGWNLQSNGANAGAIRTGDTVDIGTVAGEENLTVTKDGNNIKYGLNRDLKVDSVRAGDTLINDNGVTITNGPSITKSGINAAGNTISNVADGTAPSDAVNKGQLDKAAAAAKTEVTQGKNITVSKTTGADGQDIYNVATADNVDFNNVTVGDVTIDGTTGKISGVTAGEVSATSDEAINGSQLAGTAKSVSDALGGGSTVNSDGTVTAPSYTVNGNNVSNVGAAISELDKGWNLQTNGANAGAIRTGDTVDIGTVNGEENLTVTKDGNNIKYGLNRDLKVDSVRAGDTLINDNGVTITNGPSITKSGINAAGNTISNVADGTAPSDAVNKGQLDKAAAAAKTEVTQGKNITVSKTTGADGQDIYNVATADNVDFNNVTVGGANGVNIDGNTGKISGVTDGTIAAGSKDAVNGGQLNDSVASTGDILGGGVTNEGGKLNGPFTVNDKGYDTVADAIQGEAAAAKTEVEAGKNMTVESRTGADGQTIYEVATADDVSFDSVQVGDVNIDGTTGKISGVTDGTVAAGSTEAVNGGQLHGVADSVRNSIGGETTLNPDGSITTANVGNTGENNIHDAIDSVRGKAVAAKTTVTEGDNIVVTESTNADGSTNYEVATARDVDFDSVQVGDVNIDGTTGKISGVTDGTIAAGSKDAVNGGQLNDSVASTGDILGGGVTNEGGKLNGPFTVNDKGYDTVADAIQGEAAAAKTEVEAGKNMTVESRTGADGQTIYEVATADDVSFDSVQVGDVNIDGTTGKISGVTDGTVAAGSTEAVNGGQLHGVADSVRNSIGGETTLNPDGSITTANVGNTGQNNIHDAIDSVRGQAVAAKTEVEAGKNMTVESRTGTDGQTIYEVATADDVSFDSVQVGDVNIDGTTGKISGVTDGTVAAGSKDAVNGGQLNDSVASTGDILGGGVTNEGGKLNGPFTVNDKGYDTVADAIQGEAAAAKTEVEAGKNMTVESRTGADGQTIYEVATADDVSFDSVQVGEVNIDGTTGKISGVTDGTIAAGSKDAVNGGQLHGVADSVRNSIGGETTLNPDGSITTANVGNTGENNIHDAIDSVRGQAVAAKTTVTEGDNIVVTESTNADGSINYEVATAKDVKFDSVTAGNTRLDNSGVTVTDAVGNSSSIVAGGTVVKDAQGNNTAITASGTTIKNAQGDTTLINSTGLGFTDAAGNPTGPRVDRTGIDAGGSKLTNVADGTIAAGSKEAVNGGQLNDSVASTGDILGGGVTNEGGKLNGPFTVNDKGYDTVADAIQGEAAAAKTEVEAGKNMTVESRTGADGQTIYEVATADDVDFNNVTVGGADGVRIDGTTGKISGVTDGTVAAGSKEVVNGGQLHGVADSVRNSIGGETTLNPDGSITTANVGNTGQNNIHDAIDSVRGKAVAAKTTVTEGDNIVVTESTNADGSTNYEVATARDVDFDSVQVGDVNIDGTTGKISGVTDGTIAAGSKDAVNGGQLNDSVASTGDILGGGVTNEGGKLNGPFTVNDKGYDTVADAIQGEAAAAKTEVTEGKNVTVTKTTGADGQDIYNVATKDDVSFDSVQVGDVNIDGATGKISGVADGTIAAGSKDAINGSQLNDSITSTGDILGGGVTNEGGKLNGPFTVSGKGYDTVADAIQGEAAAAKTEVTEGKNVTVTKTTGADGQDIYNVATKDDVSFDSVQVGDVNIDGTTGKISGVADGTIAAGSTEAINGGQIHSIADSVKNSIGGETTLNPDGSITTGNVGNTGQNNIHDAIDSVRGQAVAAKTTVTEGDNMVVTQSKNADGSTNYEVATAKDVKFDSVTATDADGNETILDAKGVSLKDQAGNTTILGQDGLGFADPMGNSVGPRISARGIDAGNTVITGVAPGRIATDSTDAINGSQLKGVADSVSNAIGGNTTVNSDGTIVTKDIGGTGKDNINDAIGAVGKAAQEAKTTVSKAAGDENVTVSSRQNADGSTDYEVGLSKDVKVDSVTAGDTVINGDGLTIAGGPSVTKDGIDAGDNKVTGVADGTIAAGSKDAINGGQLHGVADSVKNVVGGNAKVNPDGSITTSNVGGTGKNNIDDAINSVRGAAAAAKSTVSNKDGNISVNETTKADGSKDFEVGLAKDITVDSVTAKDVNANQVNVGGAGGTTIAADGVRIAEGPSMTKEGINAGGKKVTGVADGAIASGSKDGINGGQLHRSYEDVGAALGGGAGYDPSTGWKGPSYDVAGGKYDNVGDALGAIDNRVTNLGDQLQQAFYDTNKRMDKLEDKMSAGIAATAALENAPFVPGKLTMAAGAAYYNDQSAIGVTFRKTADNGRWSLTTGAAMGSQGNSPLVRVGVSTIID